MIESQESLGQGSLNKYYFADDVQSDPHEFSLDELSQYFHLPINDVAKQLGVCATVLKKICRKNGINRWPHRKIKSIDTMIEALEEISPTSTEDSDQIQSELDVLRRKRDYLLRNPNASYKSVVPKCTINACNARIQKAGITPSTPTPILNTASKLNITSNKPYKKKVANKQINKPSRISLSSSQEELQFAALELMSLREGRSEKIDIDSIAEDPAIQLYTHLPRSNPSSDSEETPATSPVSSPPTLSCADEPVSVSSEDQASFENFVTSLPTHKYPRVFGLDNTQWNAPQRQMHPTAPMAYQQLTPMAQSMQQQFQYIPDWANNHRRIQLPPLTMNNQMHMQMHPSPLYRL